MSYAMLRVLYVAVGTAFFFLSFRIDYLETWWSFPLAFIVIILSIFFYVATFYVGKD